MFYFNVPIKKGTFLSGINTFPAIQYSDGKTIVDGVFLEELPSATQGVEYISVLNPGYGYQTAPLVTINGDGTGATAVAQINNAGSITAINVTNSGNNYTVAYATITPVTNDTTGQLGAAVVNLQGRYGTLSLYRIDGVNGKVVVNSNIGTVDYENGVITLSGFNPSQVDNDLGQLTLSVNPTTSIVSSTYNRIITVDPYDSNAININVTAKTS